MSDPTTKSQASEFVPWIQEVRSRLAKPSPARLPHSDDRQAAVLVPLYVDAGELWTVLTRRSQELRHHSGQIGFPGGGLEGGEDLWQGALREAREEIDLDTHSVLQLGNLDEQQSSARYRVVPCVGAVPFPLEIEADGGEIEDVFSIPLTACANPQWVEEREITLNDKPHWIRIYHVGRHQIWGLTARIIQNLLERLGMSQAVEISPN